MKNQTNLKETRAHFEAFLASARRLGSGRIRICALGESPKDGRKIGPIEEWVDLNDPSMIEQFVARFSETDGANLYYTPAVFSESAQSRTKNQVTGIHCIVLDFDEDGESKLGALPKEPNILLETSPGRYQAIFFLDEPIRLDSEESRETLTRVLKGIAKAYGADPVSATLSQLFRMGGTVNWPNKKKVASGRTQCKTLLHRCEYGETISLKEFRSAKSNNELETGKVIKKEQANTSGKVQYDLERLSKSALRLIKEIPQIGDDRSANAYRVIKECFDKGFTSEQTLQMILDHPSTVGAKYESSYERTQKDVDRVYAKCKLESPFLTDKNKNGSVKCTKVNIVAILDFHKISIRYNLMSRRTEITSRQNESLNKLGNNDCFTFIEDVCTKYGIANRTKIINFAKLIGKENSYCPIQKMILRSPWDKKQRIDRFCERLTVPLEQRSLRNLLIRKWLTSMVAAVFEDGFHARGVLVLQGRQGIGKTTFFRKVCEDVKEYFAEGFLLDVANKDSVVVVISKWLVELGEIEATFRRSDNCKLKSFITQTTDEIRKPYREEPEIYPRRTVLCGSVNETTFLNDRTGNSRFWPIECLSIDYEGEFEMQQIFAEVYETLYSKGETWWLSNSEEELLTNHNRRFTSIDPVEEALLCLFDFDSPKAAWDYKSIPEIIQASNFESDAIVLEKRDSRKIGSILSSLPGTRSRRVSKGMQFYTPPYRKPQRGSVVSEEAEETLNPELAKMFK